MRSGALDCSRNDISYALIRAAISGSPIARSRSRFEAPDRIQRVALQSGIDARGVLDEEHRGPLRAKRHALIDRGQEAAVEAGRSAAYPGLAKDDVGREVLRVAAQAVGDPRSHARFSELQMTGVQKELRRGMIECVGVDRLDDRDVVGDRAEVRQHFRNLRPARPVS